MDNNIFTPEEAKTPVTYGDLIAIFTPLIEEAAKSNTDIAIKMMDTLADTMVKIRDDAEYNRIRDIKFMITLIAQMGHCDKEALVDSYKRWCDEFDKLNKPNSEEK